MVGLSDGSKNLDIPTTSDRVLRQLHTLLTVNCTPPVPRLRPGLISAAISKWWRRSGFPGRSSRIQPTVGSPDPPGDQGLRRADQSTRGESVRRICADVTVDHGSRCMGAGRHEAHNHHRHDDRRRWPRGTRLDTHADCTAGDAVADCSADPTATPAPTPSATPIATPVATPTPTPGVTVTTTCSNVPP